MGTKCLLLALVFLSFAFINEANAQVELRGEISGRIVTEMGRSVRRVSVLVMDLNTLETRTVVSNDFGYFVVDDLQFGSTFLVNASSGRYYFAFPFQTVNLDLVSRQVNFIAAEFPVALPKAP
ncbi:MAG: carboxypeptidase regulatory-like domain-containing protein [Acidobacteria bacterium]|nr:carboxypeptidase regulatory-like domain-containing protein [Acidobacteriota bacterium]MBK8810029.1 carboxypeptidase regulatory-like domain-containing protein [Acidobacteriota bacterium]